METSIKDDECLLVQSLILNEYNMAKKQVNSDYLYLRDCMKLKFEKIFDARRGNQPFHRSIAIGGGGAKRYSFYLCAMLENIAQSAEDCNRLLMKISEARKLPESESVNDGLDETEVCFGRRYTQINIVINDEWIGDENGRFYTNEIESAIGYWKEFLEDNNMGNIVVEVDI